MADDLEIALSAGAFTIRLRVTPAARKDAILGLHGGALKICVTAPPEKGKANAGVIKLLAGVLALPVSCFEITAGLTGRDKRLRILGFPGTADQLKLRLSCA